jgi:hypothetical protein
MTEIEKVQITISKIDSAIAMLGGASHKAREHLAVARHELIKEVVRLRALGMPEGTGL